MRLRMLGLVGQAAGQGAGEQLAHDAEARALVLAERNHGAARLAEHYRAVAADVPLRIEQALVGHRHAGIGRDPRLAEGDLAGRHVEHD